MNKQNNINKLKARVILPGHVIDRESVSFKVVKIEILKRNEKPFTKLDRKIVRNFEIH